jgi:hypothetical protein
MTVDYKERRNKVCKTMLTILTKKVDITLLNKEYNKKFDSVD